MILGRGVETIGARCVYMAIIYCGLFYAIKMNDSPPLQNFEYIGNMRYEEKRGRKVRKIFIAIAQILERHIWLINAN